MIGHALAMLPADRHWRELRQGPMKAGTTRKCINARLASNPCATPCTNVPGNPRDRKHGPWTRIDANARGAKATAWLFVPWPMSGSGSFVRCGSSTKAMRQRHCWQHDIRTASSRPEMAAERCIRCSYDSKTPCCFFAVTGTSIPDHASAAVSRKAKRLDTSKRRGTRAAAYVMANNVSAAAALQRLDIQGLPYRRGHRFEFCIAHQKRRLCAKPPFCILVLLFQHLQANALFSGAMNTGCLLNATFRIHQLCLTLG